MSFFMINFFLKAVFFSIVSNWAQNLYLLRDHNKGARQFFFFCKHQKRIFKNVFDHSYHKLFFSFYCEDEIFAWAFLPFFKKTILETVFFNHSNTHFIQKKWLLVNWTALWASLSYAGVSLHHFFNKTQWYFRSM